MENTAILHYIDQLENAMHGDLWIDETFGRKLKDVHEDNAFNRPLPNVHSVAEVISHLLEWRICILHLIQGGTRTLRDESPNNWRGNEELSATGWQSLLAAFNKSQEEIIHVLQTKKDDDLDEMARGELHNLRYYVDGLLQHDMYHLGQIGLILKMLK